MALTTIYEQHEAYLLVTTTGTSPDKLDEALGYIEELLAVAARYNHPPILLDRTGVTHQPTAPEQLLELTASLFLEHGYIRPTPAITATIYRDRRLAILVAPTAVEHILAAESALHARNVNSRYFTDRPTAIDWLTTPTH